MSLEFVFVAYPTSRTVYVDGNRAGFTNTILVVETGHHVFDLGNPKNYAPEEVRREVRDTSVISPMQVAFERNRG